MIPRTPLAVRFEAKVDRSGGPDACHPWIGGAEYPGYGKINAGGFRGKTLRAHRVAFALANGIDPLSLPASVSVCHSCDNPPCCNGRHLFAGDAAANAADCLSKGRTVKGRHPCRTLIPAVVPVIHEQRRRGRTISEIARHHDVSETTVRRVLAGTHWTVGLPGGGR